MLDLSIIMLFCDKDFYYLENKLKELKQKINLSYEILLLDNRENNKDPIPELDENVKYFSYGKNCYNYSRHSIVKHASGKYVWFIDVDDEIFNIDETFKEYILSNEEEICFNFILSNEENPGQTKNASRTYFPIWSRWIRTDLAKEKLKKLNLVPIVFFDDDIIIYQFKDLKKIISENYIYFYRVDRSTFYNKEGTYSANDLKKFLNLKIIEDELKSTNSLEVFDVIISLIKKILLKVKSVEDLQEYLDFVLKLEINPEIKKEFLKKIMIDILERKYGLHRPDKIVLRRDKIVRTT